MSAEILSIITVIVSFILGVISKKVSWINNKIIPLQNLIIGISFAIVQWIITKDFSASLAISGLLAGGIYDIFHNLESLIRKE